MMNYKGIKVKHKNFGTGRIVDNEVATNQEEDIVYVRFDSKPDILKFKVPSAFNNGYLSSDNSALIQYLRKKSESNTKRAQLHTCILCGNVAEEVDISAKKLYCNSCKSKITKCFGCKKYIVKKTAFVDTGKYYCEDCFSKLYYICDNCGIPEKISNRPTIERVKKLCPECASINRSAYCSICKELLSDNAILWGKEWVCQKCYSTTKCLTVCGTCKGKFIYSPLRSKETLTKCQECASFEEYLKYIYSMDMYSLKIENCSFANYKKRSSRELMTFLKMDDDNYILGDPTYKKENSIDILLVDSGRYAVVIIPKIPKDMTQFYIEGGTATEFKQVGCAEFIKMGQVKLDVPFRRNSLHLWRRPIKLHAQTEFDVDYGDKWYWNGNHVKIDHGNKYGDTSDFWVIGYLDT